MKLAFPFLLYVLMSCSFRMPQKAIENVILQDTIFIKIDSTSINKTENTFDLVLIYKEGKTQHEVYRIKNRDYSIELNYNFHYSDKRKDYWCYTVNDLPTGIRWDIIFNGKTKVFYKTEAYDKKALGDSLTQTGIDFIKETAIIQTSEGSNYIVKLTKIWDNR